MSDLLNYFRTLPLGSPIPDFSYREKIEKWRMSYRGFNPKFHHRINYNGTDTPRPYICKRLKMGKRSCEEWANLMWNNDCNVSVTPTGYIEPEPAEDGTEPPILPEQELIDKVLQRNDFTTQTNLLIEKAFGLSLGAYLLIEGDTPEHTRIEYYNVDFIYPLEWDGKEILSCAFVGTFENANGDLILYSQAHVMNADEVSYTIFNAYFKVTDASAINTRDASTYRLIPLPELNVEQGVEPEAYVPVKIFSIVKPNLADANNSTYPVGISVLDNAKDPLEGCDEAYNGWFLSLRVGLPKIAVSNNAMATVGADGKPAQQYFDYDSLVYQSFPASIVGSGGAGDNRPFIADMSPEMRASQFAEGVEAAISYAASCVGLSPELFKFENGQVRTATEVVATDRKMLRNLEKNQQGLRSSIKTVLRGILSLAGYDPDNYDIKIIFDDSLTRDVEAERARAYQRVKDGYMSNVDYLVKYEGYSRHEALQEVNAAKQDTTQQNDDTYQKEILALLGNGENSPTTLEG